MESDKYGIPDYSLILYHTAFGMNMEWSESNQ